MHHDFQLTLAQLWILSGLESDALDALDRDEAARQLVHREHQLAGRMIHDSMRQLRHANQPIRGETLLLGTAARPISPDIEAVALFLESEVPDGVFPSGEHRTVLAIPVHVATERPLVLGAGWIAQPGWPPKMLPIDGSPTG